MKKLTLPFDEIDNKDVARVGGKNASLGEMFTELKSEGIDIPDGFATTSEAYWIYIDVNNLRDKLADLLDRLDKEEFSNLEQTGNKLREKIMQGKMPEDLVSATDG